MRQQFGQRPRNVSNPTHTDTQHWSFLLHSEIYIYHRLVGTRNYIKLISNHLADLISIPIIPVQFHFHPIHSHRASIPSLFVPLKICFYPQLPVQDSIDRILSQLSCNKRQAKLAAKWLADNKIQSVSVQL